MPGRTEENYEIQTLDSQCHGRNLNMAHSQYQSQASPRKRMSDQKTVITTTSLFVNNFFVERQPFLTLTDFF
jgi:hypothetical protein